MLYLYLGTDREKARAKMNAAIAKAANKAEIVRITDVHTLADLKAALQGGGMFGGKRVLVFEGVCVNPDLCDVFLVELEMLSQLDDPVFIYEEKPLADLRKKLEKHAETVEKFDAPKKERDASIFAMANALRRKDKKALWIAYMREIAKGSAPEAIHGVLFWSAKDMFLKSREGSEEHTHASRLLADLAELPHVARRRGEDLEYALERYVLCV
jgi:DNA polymerase III delta subunit